MNAALSNGQNHPGCAVSGMKPKRSARGFLSDEQGAVTIEFVALVPMFLAILMFFADCSIMYLTHSEMFNAARDIARRMSTGEITSVAEARDHALASLHLGDRVYVLATDPVLAELTVTIAVPMRDAAVFGAFLSPVLGETMVASATMRREPLL